MCDCKCKIYTGLPEYKNIRGTQNINKYGWVVYILKCVIYRAQDGCAKRYWCAFSLHLY